MLLVIENNYRQKKKFIDNWNDLIISKYDYYM